MALKFYNTLTRHKEEFAPLKKGLVSMYHCGPTVYDYAHIGNLRSYVFADTLRRTLEYDNLKVKQVINITDVGHLTSDEDEGEDKVEQAAREKKKTVKEIIEHYTSSFLDDLKRLNVKTSGTLFPRASKHIAEQIELIKALEEKGFTYKTSDGVYFDTSKFKTYGQLGKLDLTHLKARVAENPEKRNPVDFALWKFSKPEDKRQQEWPSPWGVGFPGWHIECSAMSMKYLGETFDIHTGGIDHISVHHTNEIAQSESATGKLFVRLWLHSEFVTVSGQKMAKSEGNLITLNDIIKKGFNPLAYRYWLLTAHYRTPVNFTWEALEGAQTALDKLYEHYRGLEEAKGAVAGEYQQQFKKFVNDDLDTPQAIALLWQFVKDENINLASKKATILDFDRVLGLNFEGIKKEPISREILQLVEEREQARKNEDWTKADKLRKEIKKLGYKIEDTPKGPKITISK